MNLHLILALELVRWHLYFGSVSAATFNLQLPIDSDVVVRRFDFRPLVNKFGPIDSGGLFYVLHLDENLHADLSLPPSELIRLGSWSIDLSNFGAILTNWNWPNLVFPGISWRTHWGNGLPFCMLMYLEHLQNWVDYGHSFLFFFIILALFWLHEIG